MAEKKTTTKKAAKPAAEKPVQENKQPTANEPAQEEVPQEETPQIENALVQPEEPAAVQAERASTANDPVRGRWTQAKAVLYTDGLSGDAEQNLERAYEYNERLQSNNPDVRRAGDESLSDAAKENRDDRDARESQQVIDGGRL